MAKLTAAATALVLLLSLRCPAQTNSVEKQIIFQRHVGDYHTYRIPALLVTTRGTLLAFCEGRKNGKGDAGNIDLLLKRSTDDGKNWSETKVIWDDRTNTCGNPCVVQDSTTGTIFLFATHNLGDDHEKDIHSDTSKESRTVWLLKSDDDGLSWTKPIEITSAVKLPSWRWYATGPGIGIEIKNGAHKGRLVIPCDHSIAVSNAIESQSHVIYSDDHGKSWKVGGTIAGNMNECQVAEIGTKGFLLMSMRNTPRGNNRAQSISEDGGLTWSAPRRPNELIDPTCQASILRYQATPADRAVLLFSNPADPTRRRHLTIRVSKDDGETWSKGKLLESNEAAYSCLAQMHNGTIACLYESGEKDSNEQITYARFPFSWLQESRKSR